MNSISPISVESQGGGNTIYPPKRCRSWCFTLNNHTKKDVISISRLFSTYKIKKLIFQEEVGENNTPHLQGVIQFENQFLFENVKLMIPKAHIEKCRNIKASIKYCSKEDTKAGKCFTFGIKPRELYKANVKLTEEEILTVLKKRHQSSLGIDDNIYEGDGLLGLG